MMSLNWGCAKQKQGVDTSVKVWCESARLHNITGGRSYPLLSPPLAPCHPPHTDNPPSGWLLNGKQTTTSDLTHSLDIVISTLPLMANSYYEYWHYRIYPYLLALFSFQCTNTLIWKSFALQNINSWLGLCYLHFEMKLSQHMQPFMYCELPHTTFPHYDAL